MNEKEAAIALNSLKNLGPIRINNLVEHFKSYQKILKATTGELKLIKGIGTETSKQIKNWENNIDLTKELRLIKEHEAKIILKNDTNYPKSLHHIHDPPILLYCIGDLKHLDFINPIAMVGSRKYSIYGINSARKIAYQLASAGITIISGLARGIDSSSHEGALASKGRTIAIIGSGFGNIYPKENIGLAKRITKQGALISEYPINYPPDKINFPIRNRLISGWSDGVIVVECGLKSGSLITANLAAEQGKLVFAIPGQIDNKSSLGSNKLIQEGAKLIIDSKDVIDELNQDFGYENNFTNNTNIEKNKTSLSEKNKKKTESNKKLSLNISEEEKIVYDLLNNQKQIDDIIQESNLNAGKVFSILTNLEVKNVITQLPGKIYIKKI